MSTEGMLDLEDERAYVLSELEVFNWGPFAGKHRAEFDERGTAIIGSTGSGKTTLVDGLMTLLADPPRYNLASTGGHDKNDRTLLSYIRGQGSGPGGKEVTRPGKTVTALGASYRNSRQTLRVMAIFWTDGSSNSQQDLKRRWFVAEDPEQSLDRLLLLWQQDGARALMKHGRETAGLRPFESKKAYLAHLRRVFDVSENAFNLLNRAAGLKQLDSVDAIFRELVLDDKSAFGRALEVAADFDNLSAIHKELEDARRQRDSLEPIAESWKNHQQAHQKLAEVQQLKQLAPRWYAALGVKIWEEEKQRLTTSLEKTSDDKERARSRLKATEDREKLLQEIYLELGGSDIEQLEESITLHEERLASRERKAADYQSVVSALGMEGVSNESQFLRNREQIMEQAPRLEGALQEIEEEESEARSRLRDAVHRCEELERTIREVKASPGSNIPPKFQHFRRELADHLGLAQEDLPYVAELIEVKSDEAEWRGAIERAVGPNRLRILVPDDHLREALHWVNHRDNRLHVRLQEARLDEAERDYFHDSYIYKLNLKPHPLQLALENLLARHDYHCVPDTATLQQTPHGLTREGTMSSSNGRFDKQDQRRLSEGWLTGFDNRDQLHALARELLKAQEEHETLAPIAQTLREKRRASERELDLLKGILELRYEEIDTAGAGRQLEVTRKKLQRLLAPDSKTSAAKAAHEEARRELKTQQEELSKIDREIGGLETDISRAEDGVSACQARLGDPLTEEQGALCRTRFKAPDDITAARIDEAERQALQKLDQTIDRYHERIRALDSRLVSLMEKARALDEGAYVDVGTALEDIPAYLTELETLVREALPEKEKRFREYLNRSSDQGVTQLLAHIDQEVTNIGDRIVDLNQTLAKVDYRENHYLQLQAQALNDSIIRELEKARRHLRDAVLKEDEGRGQFKALQDIVTILRDAGNNRHLVGSRALLDPRYRLQFFVVEVDRSSGKASSGRTGSHGDSGGEKELMSSHILTASLSYALCPSGASRPLYGTIVLDEAFSKTSEARARLIAKALNVFGLYPVFVTPNKEISLLKKHTRRAICVQKGARGSTLATISWERLAELQPES